MNDDRKRLSKGFGVAIVVHLIVALLLGVFGFTFNSNRPPEILEVTLTSGSPQEQQEEVVEEKVVVQEPDPIVDQKLKPQEEKKVVKEQPKKTTNKNTTPGDNKSDKNDAVGNGKGVPVTPPRILSAREPAYPATARKQGIEGTVYVKMLVNNSGKVEEAFVAKSSGHEDLDASAVQAVYKWRFSPAKDKLKQKVACYITIPVNFKLRK